MPEQLSRLLTLSTVRVPFGRTALGGEATFGCNVQTGAGAPIPVVPAIQPEAVWFDCNQKTDASQRRRRSASPSRRASSAASASSQSRKRPIFATFAVAFGQTIQ